MFLQNFNAIPIYKPVQTGDNHPVSKIPTLRALHNEAHDPIILLCQFDIFRVYWGHDQETTFASSPQHANARTRRVFSPVSGAL
jgi:hypothetical protein